MNLQTGLNILISSSGYLLIAISFQLIYNVTKFFNLSHAILISGSAYLCYHLIPIINNFYFAAIISIISFILLYVILYITIYGKLEKNKSSSLILLISSLGVYVIFENLISIFSGSEVKTFRNIVEVKYYILLNQQITNFQLFIIATAVLIFILLIFLFRMTAIGRELKAISSNKTLAELFGIKINTVIIIALILSAFIASLSGILISLDTDLTPSMGFNLLLYGIVTMIIGGVGNFRGLIAGSFLLAIAQNLGAFYIDSKWMNVITYLILIIFLICKPLGFSGIQLKKVEV